MIEKKVKHCILNSYELNFSDTKKLTLVCLTKIFEKSKKSTINDFYASSKVFVFLECDRTRCIYHNRKLYIHFTKKNLSFYQTSVYPYTSRIFYQKIQNNFSNIFTNIKPGIKSHKF